MVEQGAKESKAGPADPASTRYDHQAEKARSFEDWASCGTGPAGSGRAPAFSILIPPLLRPGRQRISDLAELLIADVFARYREMRGETVSVVTQFAADSGSDLLEIWRRLGGRPRNSVRISMEDAKVAPAVAEAFWTLLNRNLLRRVPILVKWCPSCRKTLAGSDLRTVSETGNLWLVRCPVAGVEDRFLTIATEAPETLAASVGFLVPSGDENSRALGKLRIMRPCGTGDAPVIVTPAISVQKGIGATALVPGASPREFSLALSLGMPAESLFHPDGTLTKVAGPFQCLTAPQARDRALQDLEEKGLIESIEKKALENDLCARCGSAAVPLASVQWKLRMGALAEKAAAALQEGAVSIHPREGEKEFLSWARSLTDQNLSRWDIEGLEVPLRACTLCGEIARPGEAEGPCAKCGNPERRPEGTLEPWFAETVATLAGLGWPGEPGEAGPEAWVCADRPSFFSWAARVLLLGLELTGRVPFRAAFLHGKMEGAATRAAGAPSGETPADAPDGDPDAFRLAIAGRVKAFRDLVLSPEPGVAERQFLHKAWNAVRFALLRGAKGSEDEGELLSPEDRWILSRLEGTVSAATGFLEDLDPGGALKATADFLRRDLCEWYLPMAGERIRRGPRPDACRRTLLYAASTVLRLLHPFAPFQTESLRRRLAEAHPGAAGGDRPLPAQPWPIPAPSPEAQALDRKLAVAKAIVQGVRNIRSNNRVPRKVPLDVTVSFFDRPEKDLVEDLRILLGHIVNAGTLTFGVQTEQPKLGAMDTSGDFQIFVPLEVREYREKEVERLRRRLCLLEDEFIRITRLLESWEFFARAPAEVSSRARRKKETLSGQIRTVRDYLGGLRRDLAKPLGAEARAPAGPRVP